MENSILYIVIHTTNIKGQLSRLSQFDIVNDQGGSSLIWNWSHLSDSVGWANLSSIPIETGAMVHLEAPD